jgi:hypothetical protein
VRGRALLFFPADARTARVDERAAHEAEPLGEGAEKWIIQVCRSVIQKEKWIIRVCLSVIQKEKWIIRVRGARCGPGHGGASRRRIAATLKENVRMREVVVWGSGCARC